MTVRIDADRCKGHARCMLLNPDLFGMDDEGHGLVTKEPAPGELADVRAAIANCPERAITYDLARARRPETSNKSQDAISSPAAGPAVQAATYRSFDSVPRHCVRALLARAMPPMQVRRELDR
jgi:ferredoxin